MPVTKRTFDAEVAALAAEQGAVLSRCQVRRLGGTDNMIRSRLRSGLWVPESSGVYRIAGAPGHPDRDLWVAHLAVGDDSTISHQAAGRMEGLTGFGEAPPVVTVAHPSHRRVPDGVVLHQLTDMTGFDTRRLRGLPVTKLHRTFVDLSAVVSEASLKTALEDAIVARRITLAKVSDALARIARPGKRGLRTLMWVLDELATGPVPPASELERILDHVLALAGLTHASHEFPVPGDLPGAGRVDRAFEEALLIIEADGRRWHARQQAMRRDHDRDLANGRVGWHTMRFLYEMLTEEPAECAALIRDTYSQRVALLSRSA